MSDLELTIDGGKTVRVPAGIRPKDLIDGQPAIGATGTLAAVVDGQIWDLHRPLESGGNLRFVTFAEPEGRFVYWHSAAHLMAHAVKELWPESQLTIGPPIAEGFYYDIDSPHVFTQEDFPLIEAKMAEISKRNLPLKRKRLDKDEAIRFFESQGEHYKVELIRDLTAAAAAGPDQLEVDAGPELTIYEQGNWADLLPRPARRHHRPHQAFQDPLRGRRLLARRRAQQDAAAALCDGLPDQRAARRASDAHRGSQAPRPSQAGQGTRSLQLPYRIAGRGLSASARADHLGRDHPLLEGAAPRARLRGDSHTTRTGRRAVAQVGALGPLPRKHVFHGSGKAEVRPQADELPGPLPRLFQPPGFLPRSAAQALRNGRRAPLRKKRRFARPVPRARVHAGRRAYLRDAGADRDRGRQGRAVHLRDVPRFRLRGFPHRTFHPARLARGFG